MGNAAEIFGQSCEGTNDPLTDYSSPKAQRAVTVVLDICTLDLAIHMSIPHSLDIVGCCVVGLRRRR